MMSPTRRAAAIRFSEKLARPMGRGTAGVKGMNVSDKGNRVLSLDVVDHQDKKGELLVVTENGYGKRTAISEYPVKGRGGKGVLTAKLTAKKGGLAGARVVREGQALLFISQNGMVQRNAISGISRMGRPTQGVRVMNLKKGDRVSAVALVVESDQNGNGSAPTDASVEEGAPTSTTDVADEAAAAEAAGNGEARVTKARSSGAAPAKSRSAGGSAGRDRSSGSAQVPSRSRKAASKTKAKPAASPAKKRAAGSSARKPARKVKPKHTATAKQRAESAKKRKK
jgi:hypothetical protein